MCLLARFHAVAISLAALLTLTACEDTGQSEPADSDSLALRQDTMSSLPDSTRLANNTFSDWNRDGDADLTQDEFEEQYDSYGHFDSLDGDGDGELSRSEFEEEFAAFGDFDTLDADKNSVLSESELNTGVFGRWDANNDQLLDENEWNRGMSSWQTE